MWKFPSPDAAIPCVVPKDRVSAFLPNDNIFASCRKGDLARIKHLVEIKEVDLNVRDCWDSTPLYYACLCGHKDVVKYLLSMGAKCEEQTFDGERCLYGALTMEIKMLILESQVASLSTQRRDLFDQFCEKLLLADDYSDFTIRLSNGKALKLHRCVLATRCPGLKDLLQGKWKDQDEVKVNHVDPLVFEEFVKYLYTGKLKCTRDQYDAMIQLGKRCQMATLLDHLGQSFKKSEEFEVLKRRGVRVTTLVVDNGVTRQLLERDFFDIVDAGMDQFYKVVSEDPFLGFRFRPEDQAVKEDMEPCYDISLKVENVMFSCNKAFLCLRSEYLKTLIENPFGEYREKVNSIEVVQLQDVSASVLTVILYYIYTNTAFSMTAENVYEVLETSDIYLLPGLTKQCGNFICSLVTHENVIDLLQTSRVRNIPRLEDRCTEYLAENVEFFVEDPSFQALVREDAATVVGRQETDTITVIDEIRYHINLLSYSLPEEVTNLKFNLIEELLDKLNLEA